MPDPKTLQENLVDISEDEFNELEIQKIESQYVGQIPEETKSGDEPVNELGQHLEKIEISKKLSPEFCSRLKRLEPLVNRLEHRGSIPVDIFIRG